MSFRQALAGSALALLTGAAAGCMTHLLGDTDTGAVRDSLELNARIYQASDAGKVRAFARAAYCSDLGVLTRSGAAPVYDAGAPIPCEVAK